MCSRVQTPLSTQRTAPLPHSAAPPQPAALSPAHPARPTWPQSHPPRTTSTRRRTTATTAPSIQGRMKETSHNQSRAHSAEPGIKITTLDLSDSTSWTSTSYPPHNPQPNPPQNPSQKHQKKPGATSQEKQFQTAAIPVNPITTTLPQQASKT